MNDRRGGAVSSSDSFNGSGWGGSGGAGSATDSYEAYPETFELECRLLPTNCGMGGNCGKYPWVCLGIVRQISVIKNLWVRRK